MLKDTLAKLEPAQRQQLMYCFEEGITQVVFYADGKFIGVNVRPSADFKLIEVAGDWCLGELISDSKETKHDDSR